MRHCSGPGPVRRRTERQRHRFDERILEPHVATGSREEASAAPATAGIDIAPASDGRVQAFDASPVTGGFRRDHGLE